LLNIWNERFEAVKQQKETLTELEEWNYYIETVEKDLGSESIYHSAESFKRHANTMNEQKALHKSLSADFVSTAESTGELQMASPCSLL
jgi:hypothetical protein